MKDRRVNLVKNLFSLKHFALKWLEETLTSLFNIRQTIANSSLYRGVQLFSRLLMDDINANSLKSVLGHVLF